jgi:hypothetical protein
VEIKSLVLNRGNACPFYWNAGQSLGDRPYDEGRRPGGFRPRQLTAAKFDRGCRACALERWQTVA